ncbi:MAG: hypothetical protein EBZ67_05505 [Chitinophagia bacterium]|nr:hypothetical protein [Chitinophagia bacterium]
MKIVAIGDIHGRDLWKPIVEAEPDADHYVFIGDYFDRSERSPTEQVRNFEDILEWKQGRTRADVSLLLGNHDYYYLPEIGMTGLGGYSEEEAALISEALGRHLDELHICRRIGPCLFSHAGIGVPFLDATFGPRLDGPVDSRPVPATLASDRYGGADSLRTGWSLATLEDQLDAHFRLRPADFDFCGDEPHGDDITQGPLWIRPKSLVMSTLGTLSREVVQVFGHTPTRSITHLSQMTMDAFFDIDCLGTSREYLVITGAGAEGRNIPE